MNVHSAGERPIATPPPNDKRRRILDAAVQVFAQHGFFHARVTDIAREAGVADGTIYLYFKNKDDLLISLFEDRMEGIIAAFRAELSRLEGAAERLDKFVEMHLGMVEREPQLAEVLTVELRQSSKFMREYKAPRFQEYLDILAEIFELGRRTGEFRPDLEPRILKRIIFGALDEVSLVWSSTRRDKYALADAAREIRNLCVRGLMASAAHETAQQGDRP